MRRLLQADYDPPGSGATKLALDKGADPLRAQLIAALLHPLRCSILMILAERTASARDIAAETGVLSERIGHQLRRLRREGLIRLEESRRRRGVAENYYRATLEPIIDDEEFASLSPEQRRMFSIWVIKRLYTDAGRALKAETFDSRSNSCSAHSRMLLDERGWGELAAIHREALDRVIALRRQAAARIEQSAGVGIPAASTILCFELPDLVVTPKADHY
jgi:DNA-binding transcriptional ArsR family regulator